MKRKLIAILLMLAFVSGSYFLAHLAGTCRDISCFKKEDPWFAKKMQAPELFIAPGNAQAILQRIKDPRQRQAVSVTLKQLEEKTKEIVLPRRPITCAVVGNSNNLKGSGYGRIIDSHSYVFRMNNAPTENFEKDIGRKSSVHMLHSAWEEAKDPHRDTTTVMFISNLSGTYKDPKVWDRYEQDIADQLVLMAKQLRPDIFPSGSALPDKKKFPFDYKSLTGMLLLVHPDFIHYINEYWFKPDNHADWQWPSTGFRTLMLSLHFCDRVSVFGFGKPDANTQKWEHYFPAEGRNTEGHRPEYQEEVLSELEERGIIRRYMGNEPP